MLSYSDGSPHARKAPTPSGPSSDSMASAQIRRARRVPVGDGLAVVAVLGALRVGQSDEPVAGLADEPLADLSPQCHQIVLGVALVHREDTPGCR